MRCFSALSSGPTPPPNIKPRRRRRWKMRGAPPPPVIRPPNAAAADHQFVGAQLCLKLSASKTASSVFHLLNSSATTYMTHGVKNDFKLTSFHSCVKQLAYFDRLALYSQSINNRKQMTHTFWLATINCSVTVYTDDGTLCTAGASL